MMFKQRLALLVWVAIGLLVPRAQGFPGMKSTAGGRGTEQNEARAEGDSGPPPGGTPPPATVAGLKALFGDSASDASVPLTGPGVIRGHVRDNVSTSPVLAGLHVTLAVIHGDKVVTEKQAETDGEGGFVFRDLATDSSVSYAAAVVYQGARYTSDPVAFESGGTEASLDIPVYPSGPAPGKARVKGSHIIVAGMGDAVQVTEMIFIDNPEEKTLVGSPEGVVTFQLQLPKTASNLSVDQGLQRDHISVGDGMLYYDGPLYPGSNQVVVSYLVKPATGWTFQRRMPMPVDMFDVFVKESSLRVKSPVLGGGEHLDMRGTPFLRYHGGPFEAGALLSFSLTKAGQGAATTSGPGGMSAVPVAVMVALFVSFFVALPLLRSASGKAVPVDGDRAVTRRELEAERDRHLLAVAELDLDYEAGKLNEDDYRKLRERHKSAAMAVMRRLEALDAVQAESTRKDEPTGPAIEGEGAHFCTQCGRRLAPEDRFCAQCGTRVDTANE